MRTILFLTGFLIFGCYYTQIPANAEDICPILNGEKLPKANLMDANGNTIKLNEIIEKQPTVLVFYRGGWCPYCNAQLSGLMEVEDEILNEGYQIVAISPDDYQNLKNTEEKDGINYQLYSDPNGAFIQEIGIAFEIPEKYQSYIAKQGQKGALSEVLPVPTVLVVNQMGEILFEYINPDYKVRLNPQMLLAVLESLESDALE